MVLQSPFVDLSDHGRRPAAKKCVTRQHARLVQPLFGAKIAAREPGTEREHPRFALGGKASEHHD
jgi:hypothetical protein